MPRPTHSQAPTLQISVIKESTVLADADVTAVVAALQKTSRQRLPAGLGHRRRTQHSAQKARNPPAGPGGLFCTMTPIRSMRSDTTISPWKGLPSEKCSPPAI